MPQRDIISEAARCSLDLSKCCEKTYLSPHDWFAINYHAVESYGTTGIAYDADFIESVNCIGYKRTIHRLCRFNAPSLFDAKRIDFLSNEMVSFGVDSDKGHGFEKTPSYIKISGTPSPGPDGLIEDRIPVSEDLWSKALLVSSKLRECWSSEMERINEESIESGDDFINDDASRFLYPRVHIAHVKGFDPKKDQEFSFRLPFRIDGTTKSVWVEPIGGAMRYEYFYYRYSPDLETVSYAWLMGCQLSIHALFNLASRFYLCRGVGQPFREVVRPILPEFDPACRFYRQRGVGQPFKEVTKSIFPELDDPSNFIDNRLIRGLIRIHNHLKNPDMSDEEYLSLLEGP